ncbi:MAG: hypothetical protein K5657_06615 [Desulfovibrio sp.]|nr:hypothetical protein [Desulfovibrio sp.]
MSERTCKTGIVTVRDFIFDEKGCAVGIRGETWPEGRLITVTLDMNTEKAANPRRPGFEDLRFNELKQRRDPLRHRLLPGGLLRLRLFAAKGERDAYTTDWPNVISWNGEEGRKRLRFGHGLVNVFTPGNVREKIEWLRLEKEGREALRRYQDAYGEENAAKAIEAILQRDLPSEERYRVMYSLYDPRKRIVGERGSLDGTRDGLRAYFSSEEFAPFTEYEGAGYRPVKPHLLLRVLNEDGSVSRVHSFYPGDAENVERDEKGSVLSRSFLSPDACAEKVETMLSDAERWDILPCKIYTGSMENMKLGEEQNVFRIGQIRQMSRMSVCRSGEGRLIPQVRPMGIKLAARGSFVAVESFFGSGAAENPALLSDGESYRMSEGTSIRERRQGEKDLRREHVREGVERDATRGYGDGSEGLSEVPGSPAP